MNEFKELKELILHRLTQLESDVKGLGERVTKTELQVNTITIKMWMAGLAVAFIASIVSAVVVSIIQNGLK